MTDSRERPRVVRAVARYMALRVGRLIVVILGATVLAFMLVNLLPGDVANVVLGAGAAPEARAALRAELNLDQPFPLRYVAWLGNAVTGDLGQSLTSGYPVTDLILQRLPVSAEIGLLSLLFALGAAVPVALLAARFRGGRLDQLLNLLAYGAASTPVFVTGIVLIYLVAVTWGWLPATGWTPVSESLIGNLRTALMPALSLATVQFAVFMRVLRSDAVTQVSAEEYPTAAWAKGLSMRQVMTRHVLRNSSLPLVTIVGVQIGVLLGGVVIIENLFAVPGIGNLLVQSIYQRDVTVIQGVVVFLAVVFVVLNALVDMLYSVLDPRIRYGSTRG